MSLAAGTRLDSYEIVAPLGSGGMGEVYRARDTALKRDVAIKVLPDYWSRDPERLRRFELEAQAAAALTHPNIVSIHHVGRYDGSPYIVTELLHGETLRERLRHGPMRLREVIEDGVEIARGLAAAHDAGIVHRDLKPENIFITKDGRVKILDFGLAKLNPTKSATADDPTETQQPQTNPGHVLGTVGYMSPEQVRGHTADARSDIFSAGAVLYEMLTGKPAFRKATSAETMSAILNEDPPPVSQAAVNLPPGLQKIMNRCLAKNPEQRFQHASDLAFALDALSDSSSVTSHDVQETKSSKKPLWIAVSAALLAIAATIAIWWNRPPAVPVVEAITQLTDDGAPKQGPLLTDGSRIYFGEGAPGSWNITQVSVIGGETSIVPTILPDPSLMAIAPDGSSLLAYFGEINNYVYPVWTIPLPTGEPHRLGTIEAEYAEFFPDGRVIFNRGAVLYTAEKDGSNVRRLFNAPGDAFCPSVSPNGSRIAFWTRLPQEFSGSLAEVAADGSGFHFLTKSTKDTPVFCAKWTPDGRRLIFQVRHPSRNDVWVLPIATSWLRRKEQAVPLTNGPLSYWAAVPSRDGKRIFAIGTKRRGELVRYDVASRQFLPFLSGMSGIDPTFSEDGKWVAYTSYPDHTLWRSRIDGTDRLQLTYPPIEVAYPFISPDGKQIAFSSSEGIFVIGMEGGTTRKILDHDSALCTWSPDGNSLVCTVWIPDKHVGEKNVYQLEKVDLQSGERSVIPSSQGIIGAFWITQDTLIASNEDSSKFLTFSFRSGMWTELLSGSFVNWELSPDRKYFYYTTAAAEAKTMRLRFADHKIEEIASLKDLRRVIDPVDGNTQISVAPDGSPVFTRDIGTQEIYALTVKWP